MSCNIYEEPNLIDVSYSKGVQEDGGDRVERLVDIYESVDTEHHVYLSARHRGVQRNPFRSCVLILGPLCFLLLVGSGVLSKLYIQTIAEKEKANSAYKNLQNKFDQQDCQNMTGWRRFRCSCYYKSTGKKNWIESRKDCKNRGADLVVISSKDEQEFVSKMNENGSSWIGLQTEKTDWTNEWVWKWVDGSQPGYQAWQVEVDVAPKYRTMAYVIQGWMHTNDDLRQWICEKQI